MKFPYILFFIKGPFPSEKEIAEAAAISGAKVVFRNALAVPPEAHALETCDGVTGAVPPIYAKTFPNAETAIRKHAEKLKALSEKVGDKPAPKPKPNPNQPNKPSASNPPAGNGKPPAWNPNPNPPA